MMGFRGVVNQVVFVGDLCFVACVALLISAQWEMVRGQTFSYTVLSAFGALFFFPCPLVLSPAYWGFLIDLRINTDCSL